MRLEHWRYIVPLRLRSFFRREHVERELDEELRDHLDRKIDEYIARGLTPGQARSAAMRAMGGIEQLKEACRDTRGVSGIENVLRMFDAGYAFLRNLRVYGSRGADAGAGHRRKHVGRQCHQDRASRDPLALSRT